MKNTLMKSLFTLLTLSAPYSAHADVQECTQKLTRLFAKLPVTQNLGPNGKGDYHLSQDKKCGVEWSEHLGYFTVTRFAGDTLAKFETIILNEQELTAGGRVRATLECVADDEETMTFTTKLPIFSDGVKTPLQTKTLSVKQAGKRLEVSLKSKISVLSSPITCAFEIQV